MKILQVSNLVSHHQLPLAREIVRRVGPENFRFCATSLPDEERIKLGWGRGDSESWILRSGERSVDSVEFDKWWDEADVVITGERLFGKILDRCKRGQLTLYTSERWWKPPIGAFRIISPAFFYKCMQFRNLSKMNSFNYLPIGPYAAKDIRFIAELKGKAWNWGYFPAVAPPGNYRANGVIRILWAGRMLGWKRLDTLISAFSRVAAEKGNVTLTLVGSGPDRSSLASRIKSNGLADRIFLRDPVPASAVISLMQDSDIYVLPSSEYEGWGAVINEALFSGCVVVSSRGAGAAAAIINHGENGMLFTPGNNDELYRLLLRLIDDESYRFELRNAGLRTVNELWSPSVAASRLINFCDSKISGTAAPVYESGPMSSPF